jgi:hypothetical protein
MLAKMCGWNEPEKRSVQHVHLQVDAALIAQLRSGYAELGALRSSGAKVIGAPFVANVADTPVGYARASSPTTSG